MEKYKSSHTKNIFKMSAPTWNEELELPDHILYRVFKVILNIS